MYSLPETQKYFAFQFLNFQGQEEMETKQKPRKNNLYRVAIYRRPLRRSHLLVH